VGRRRQFLLLLALIAGSTVAGPSSLPAAEPDSAIQELAHSTDFRVRVNAALLIGRTQPAGAREALERALDDGHPTVRAAAAEALGLLGDPLALTSLQRRLVVERSPSVKAQIRASTDQLRAAATASQSEDDASARPAPDVRCVLTIGTMRNASGVRGEDLRRVLADAARSRVQVLRGIAVAHDDGSSLRQAAARRVPVITLDGNVTQLTEARVGTSLQVHAAVEFTVRRDQTLRGTVSGAATTFGSGPTISDEGHRRLQDDAVDGAVESALRGAEQRLIVAAL
jgi:hypothetical protein